MQAGARKSMYFFRFSGLKNDAICPNSTTGVTAKALETAGIPGESPADDQGSQSSNTWSQLQAKGREVLDETLFPGGESSSAPGAPLEASTSSPSSNNPAVTTPPHTSAASVGDIGGEHTGQASATSTRDTANLPVEITFAQQDQASDTQSTASTRWAPQGEPPADGGGPPRGSAAASASTASHGKMTRGSSADQQGQGNAGSSSSGQLLHPTLSTNSSNAAHNTSFDPPSRARTSSAGEMSLGGDSVSGGAAYNFHTRATEASNSGTRGHHLEQEEISAALFAENAALHLTQHHHLSATSASSAISEGRATSKRLSQLGIITEADHPTMPEGNHSENPDIQGYGSAQTYHYWRRFHHDRIVMERQQSSSPALPQDDGTVAGSNPPGGPPEGVVVVPATSVTAVEQGGPAAGAAERRESSQGGAAPGTASGEPRGGE
ncbi:unnamed protein product [Amoebophrya sp. A120]|nr:unnamed protein product [Amoebophrya sp. A120]|eukprot:GSA120T00000920001.1